MRQLCRILAVTLIVCSPVFADDKTDLAAARAVFDQNIAAIRQRDRDKYLSLYMHDARLVRNGPTGFTTGFEEHAKQAGERWPDEIEASDVHLTSLQPGLVYGTYRYRVRYGADEHSGISERLFVKTPDGWKIAVTGAIDAPAGTPAPPKAITGATLIDGRGGAPVPNANIIIRDGKIDCAGKCGVPEGIDVVDAHGMWVTPGLIDAHVHFSQTGWADGRPDSLDLRKAHPYEQTEADLKAHPERFGHTYLCSGVTSVFDVGGYPWTLRLHDSFEQDTTVPHVVAAGPLLSTLDHWLNLPAERQFIHLHDEASARDGVRYLASQGSRAVKVWYIVSRAPDLIVEASAPAVNAAADEARKHNLPMIVHATGLAGSEGVAARGRECARTQRRGPARRSGVHRSREEERHDRHPDAHRARRLRAHVSRRRRSQSAAGRRSESLHRSRDAREGRRDRDRRRVARRPDAHGGARAARRAIHEESRART